MNLDEAIVTAVRAHAGQTDKAGAPYILHPLRVMARLGHGASEHERMAALLHDVVEDTPITLDDLRSRGCPEAVVAAVDHLTKRTDDYSVFIARAATNAIARKVKLADLDDNLDVTRLPGPPDERRLAKYRAAKEQLLSLQIE